MTIMSRLFITSSFALASIAIALPACTCGPIPDDAHAFVWKRESQNDEIIAVKLGAAPVKANSGDLVDVVYISTGKSLKFPMPLTCAGTLNRSVTWSVQVKAESFKDGISIEGQTITLPSPEGMTDAEQYKGLTAACIAARPEEPVGNLAAPVSFADYPVTVRWSVCAGKYGSFDTDIVAYDQVVVSSDEAAKAFAITIRQDQLQQMVSEETQEFTTTVEIKPFDWKNATLDDGQKVYFTSKQPLKRSAVDQALGVGSVSSR